MRVQGTASGLGGAGRAVRRGTGSGGFKVGRSPAGGGLAAATIASLASIDALVALQSIDETDDVDTRMVERGNDLLDGLQDLQRDLLAERVDRRTLEELERRLARDPGRGCDPALQAILRDIELRVAVELAKRGVAEPEAPDPRLANGVRAAPLRAYRAPLDPA
ncbi:MAG: flagellar assembly protein FliX [Pseudomonadota bacterium]